jgi:hypothetical protein
VAEEHGALRVAVHAVVALEVLQRGVLHECFSGLYTGIR